MDSGGAKCDTKVETFAETTTGQDLEFILEREIYEIEQVHDFEALFFNKELHLDGQSLRGVPNRIRHLQHLVKLHLGNNLLKELPTGLGELNIQILNLQSNQLRLLPDSFGDLTLLGHLRLDDNRLTALPDNFGNLCSLHWLEIQGNQLDELPPSFCHLSKLEMLKMEENQIRELPPYFGKLELLKRMAAAGNKLSALPDSFGQLRSLEYLSLELNRISILPESFGELESLEALFLGGNRIMSLPSSFRMMKALQKCSLGPLNRFRFAWPRISWFLGLRSLQVNACPVISDEAGSDGEADERHDKDSSAPMPEELGKAFRNESLE